MARNKNRDDASRRPRREGERHDDDIADMPPAVLGWEHKAAEIGQSGLDVQRSASAAEREAIARMLDVVALDRLEVSYRLRPRSGELFSLDGQLRADVRQTCVVSLEEMTTHIEEPLAAEFWPAERLSQSATPVLIDAEEGEEPLAIRDGRIETGRLVFDVLALAIDPHPRKAEAAFAWKDASDGTRERPETAPKPNPFAVLAKLKKGD